MAYFEFPYTCSVIDEKINGLRSEILLQVRSMATDFERNPDKLDYYTDQNAMYIFQFVEQYYEAVRKSNEEMRDAAETQICDLETDKSHMEAIIADLESQIYNLNQKLSNIKSTVDQL